MRHTIFTPVYNRASYMSALAEHINKIEYPKNNFEWLIINDGSTDNLLEVTKSIIDTYPLLKIRVISKLNGGIHTAQNCAVVNALGKYITRVDSDDYPLPDILVAKDKALTLSQADSREEIAGVVGLCLNLTDLSVRGTRFPEDFQITKGYILRKNNVVGDKNFCIKTKIMQEFLIPEYDDTKWVPEGGFLWLELDKKYDTCFVNAPMTVCTEANDNSYLGSLKKQNLSNLMSIYYSSMYIINNGKKFYALSLLLKSYYRIVICTILAEDYNRDKYNLTRLNQDIQSFADKLIIVLLYPILQLYKHIKR